MTFTYEIDKKLRFIVLYQYVTQTPTRINKLIDVPLSTIYDWINKLESDQDILNVMEGRGRKPVITKNTVKNLVRQTQRAPGKASTRKLGASYKMSKSKAHDVLVEKGLKYKKVHEEIDLTDKELKKRTQFCRNMLKRNQSQLKNTFFSDEMGINLTDAHTDKAWNYPNKRVKVSKPRQNVRLNCWGAVSYEGATSLHIFKETLKATTYQDILSAHIDEMYNIYPEGFQFQHDNLKAHKTSEVWGRSQGLNIIDFPNYSPQLTPIENVWAALKAAVAADNPKNETQLIRSLERNWEILTTPNALKPYFENLESIYSSCIQNKGIILMD